MDVIDNGETLQTLPDARQDFVVANHFLEHCQDPIGTIVNHFRVLKPGGVLFMAVPDKRWSFDITGRARRSITCCGTTPKGPRGPSAHTSTSGHGW